MLFLLKLVIVYFVLLVPALTFMYCAGEVNENYDRSYQMKEKGVISLCEHGERGYG